MSDSPIQERPTNRAPVGDLPDPTQMPTPSITGGVWVPGSVLTVGFLAVSLLGVGLGWWLNRRAELAEQGRLEAVQRVEEMRRIHDEDLRKRDRLQEQDRIQREREQALDRENRDNERARHEE